MSLYTRRATYYKSCNNNSYNNNHNNPHLTPRITRDCDNKSDNADYEKSDKYWVHFCIISLMKLKSIFYPQYI